jgi:rod shape determining protein RodA
MLSRTTFPSIPNSSPRTAPAGIRLVSALHWDNWLFFLIGLLVIVSFGLLYSAGNQKLSILIKHGIHVFISVGVFLAFAQVPPRVFKQWAPLLYLIAALLLLGVLALGIASKGAQRWIHLGGLRFQPSELMKLFVPLMLAAYLDNKKLPLQKGPLLVALGIIFIPGLMIAKQPDLGTALQVIATGLGVLFFAGLRWGLIIKMGALAIAGLPLLWWKLHDYQRQRVMTFLDPERDPLGSGYHIIQSKIAIGSGGLYGKGWCQGTQSQLNFLPERTTDFIFSVLGEEFGFIGVVILCVLYFSVIIRGIVIMTHVRDTFDRLLAGGIIFGFFTCIFINIGMVTGILPVVGCPLPLISYGGTALVTWMAAFGMLVSIQSHQTRSTR